MIIFIIPCMRLAKFPKIQLRKTKNKDYFETGHNENFNDNYNLKNYFVIGE